MVLHEPRLEGNTFLLHLCCKNSLEAITQEIGILFPLLVKMWSCETFFIMWVPVLWPVHLVSEWKLENVLLVGHYFILLWLPGWSFLVFPFDGITCLVNVSCGIIGDGSCYVSPVSMPLTIKGYGTLGVPLSSVALLLGFNFRVLSFLFVGKHVLTP